MQGSNFHVLRLQSRSKILNINKYWQRLSTTNQKVSSDIWTLFKPNFLKNVLRDGGLVKPSIFHIDHIMRITKWLLKET